MIPCKECISYAICLNQNTVFCSIVYKLWESLQPRVDKYYIHKNRIYSTLEPIAKYLNKSDWSIQHERAVFYTPIESSKEGPAMPEAKKSYKLSGGCVIYRKK